MSFLLPGLENLEESPFNLSKVELRLQAGFQWLIILLNALLLAMVLTNFWCILIKQEKWKTFPMLVFYVISLIAVILRLLVMIWEFEGSNWIAACYIIQPMVKAAVGLIQSWIIFELSMRFRSVNIRSLILA